MSLNPYLQFDGNAEGALELYRDALGGKADVLRFADNAEAANHVPPDWKNKIMHGRLSTPLGTIMLCDAPPQFAKRAGDNVRIAVHVESDAQAESVFAKLAAGGEVTMPLGKTFFAEKFGMCTDKFGVSWQIVPDGIADYIAGDDEQGSQRAMEAMFEMKKLDINVLRRAYEG